MVVDKILPNNQNKFANDCNLTVHANSLKAIVAYKLLLSIIAIGWLFQTINRNIALMHFSNILSISNIPYLTENFLFGSKKLDLTFFSPIKLDPIRIFFEIHIGSVSICTVSLLGFILSRIDKISTTVHNRICSISYATYIVKHFHSLKSLRKLLLLRCLNLAESFRS